MVRFAVGRNERQLAEISRRARKAFDRIQRTYQTTGRGVESVTKTSAQRRAADEDRLDVVRAEARQKCSRGGKGKSKDL